MPSVISAYIKKQPEQVQSRLNQLHSLIKECAPQAIEKISYGIPTYYQEGNLVHFAAYKNHIGFYPTPSAIERFTSKLGSYKVSKGAIQFPLSHELPLELIREMVNFRVEENLKKE